MGGQAVIRLHSFKGPKLRICIRVGIPEMALKKVTWTNWFRTQTMIKYVWIPCIPAVFVLAVGHGLDKSSGRIVDRWHNKSALFGGRDLKEGERIWEILDFL